MTLCALLRVQLLKRQQQSQSWNSRSQALSLPTTPLAVRPFLTFLSETLIGDRSTRIDVVNGERNIINLLIENNTKQNLTLLSVAGSFHHPETDRLLKNVRPRLSRLAQQ